MLRTSIGRKPSEVCQGWQTENEQIGLEKAVPIYHEAIIHETDTNG
jgi:hypothetical protein